MEKFQKKQQTNNCYIMEILFIYMYVDQTQAWISLYFLNKTTTYHRKQTLQYATTATIAIAMTNSHNILHKTKHGIQNSENK